ncbi:hypothetical protein [Acidovorax sp. Root219]|uniref:hypothetical protein n=1 Tax=Acidovorax sp. Root219 TaxID=1736493 RepID=UPI0012FC999E|nr:hypothetical protein [Acidovorax sp. Root219]
MNSHSPSPSSGRARAARGAGRRSGSSMRYLSQLQTDAYLLAREALRRVQRTSAPVEAGLQSPPAGAGAPSERRRLH